MVVNYFGAKPPQQTALQGMQQAQQQVDDASRAIAREPVLRQQQANMQQPGEQAAAVNYGDKVSLSNSPLTEQLINLSEGELVFKANARSMESAQSMLDSLLAIRPGDDSSATAEEAR